MKQGSVHHYDAFASIPYQANPAGVVYDADGLSDVEMQNIAFQVGFNETMFVLESFLFDACQTFFFSILGDNGRCCYWNSFWSNGCILPGVHGAKERESSIYCRTRTRNR